MISKLLRCLRLEKMIWRWGKSGVISNVALGMLLILQWVLLASFLSTTEAWHHSRLAPSARSSVRSLPFSSPSAQSPVPSPPFCSRSVATTIGSAFLALISLMLDAWGQAEALVAFERWSFARCRRKVLWTIVLGLNPIVGTFYVLQTMVVTWKFRARLRKQRKENGNHSYEVAKAIADSWVAVGVAKDTTIPDIYKMSPGMPVYPDPDLVLYLAGTGDPRRVEGTGDPRRVEDTGHTRRNTRAWPEGSSFHFFLLNYEGMAALLRNDVLANVDYRQLRFLGRRTLLETVIIILQAISYIIAVVYRRAKHLHVSPVEGIGFTWSLLVVVDTFVQYFLGSRSQQALLIYLTPRQEDMT